MNFLPSSKQFVTGAIVVVGVLWVLHLTKLDDKVLPKNGM